MVALKSEILNDASAVEARIDESIFISPQTLHLTLAIMKLYTPEKRLQAEKVSLSLNVC